MILTGHNFAHELQIALCHANKSIKMIVFRWSLQEEKKCDQLLMINNAIRHALRKGVEVQCLCGSEGLTRQLRNFGINAKCMTNFKIVHAKFILIDDFIFFIGSHNLTKSAMVSNLEISSLSYFANGNNEANDIFLRLWTSC